MTWGVLRIAEATRTKLMVSLTSIEESQQGQCESSKNDLEVQKKGLESLF